MALSFSDPPVTDTGGSQAKKGAEFWLSLGNYTNLLPDLCHARPLSASSPSNSPSMKMTKFQPQQFPAEPALVSERSTQGWNLAGSVMTLSQGPAWGTLPTKLKFLEAVPVHYSSPWPLPVPLQQDPDRFSTP